MRTVGYEKMPEHEFVQLIKQNPETGVKLLIHFYKDYLSSIILESCKDEVLAKDLLSEVWVRIWTKVDQYDPEKSSFGTWVKNIASNRCIDYKRHKSATISSVTFRLLEIKDEHGGSCSIDLAKMDVYKLLASLPPKYKIVVQLGYIEGYSNVQIAKILSMPVGTVKTRQRIGMRLLRNATDLPKSLKFADPNEIKKSKGRQPVLISQYTKGGVFIRDHTSVVIAAKAVGVTPSLIYQCLKCKVVTAKGYSW